MCYIWAKQDWFKEFSLTEIQNLFNEQLIRNNLEIINITGGEPTLHPGLIEIIKIILKNCIHLKRIDISTNGVNTLQIIDQIEQILTILLPTDVKLTVSISLDGVGGVHEQVRGVPGIFDKIEQTIDGLKELILLYPFFSIGFNMTISKLNYFAIKEIREYAKQKDIGINFTLAAISEIGVESFHLRREFELDQKEKEIVISSLEELSQSQELNSSYIKFLLTWLKTNKRSGNCAFRNGKAFLLEPNGETYVCGNFRDGWVGNVTKEPFGKIYSRIPFTLKHLSHRCLTCASNCYMDIK